MLFLFLGGLDYRENDAEIGYGSRGVLLDFILSLYNVMIIIALSIVNRLKYSKYSEKLIGFLSVLIFIIVVSLSGSRGIVLQFVLSVVFLFAFKRKNSISKASYLKIFLTGKNVLIIFFIFTVFGIIGYFRDQYSNINFELLYRVSEPYWYMSFKHSNKFGGDFSLLSDSFSRILQIFTNFFGSNFNGTIEGSDYYLSKYLDIEFSEGKSLPITLFGFGYLLNPYYGVIVVLFMTLLLVKFSLIINVYFSEKIIWGYEFLIFFSTSCLIIYSKSLSGVFQILIYEKFRDFLFLIFLSVLWLVSKRKIII